MPLFIENPNEEKASEKNHSMPPKFRNELLQIFQDNNIDFVFSGEKKIIKNDKIHITYTKKSYLSSQIFQPLRFSRIIYQHFLA